LFLGCGHVYFCIQNEEKVGREWVSVTLFCPGESCPGLSCIKGQSPAFKVRVMPVISTIIFGLCFLLSGVQVMMIVIFLQAHVNLRINSHGVRKESHTHPARG
jgi:hypothetical protein